MEEIPAKTPTPRRRAAAGKAPSVKPLEATQSADEVADSTPTNREDILEHNLVALELDEGTVKRIERLPRDDTVVAKGF